MAYIGNTPADKFQTLQKQSFTTSATDTYTLSYAVTNPQDLALFINNVRQNPNDAYTVSGTTLTLSSAITGSDTMYAVFLGRAVETVAPALSSVTNDMLAGSINESKLAGSISNAKLANSSITLNGSAVSLGGSANAGITEADQWKLTTSAGVAAGSYLLSANWSRQTGRGSGYFGTGMTESSGVFSFPSTGYWLVQFQQTWEAGAGVTTNQISSYIKYSDDNFSTSNTATEMYGNITQSGDYESITISYLLDVTDISNQKLKFGGYVSAGTNYIYGGGSVFYTGVTFMRLGDT